MELKRQCLGCGVLSDTPPVTAAHAPCHECGASMWVTPPNTVVAPHRVVGVVGGIRMFGLSSNAPGLSASAEAVA